MKIAAIFQLIAVTFSPALWASGYSLPIPASGAYLGIWADPGLGSGPEAAIEVREGPAPSGINHGFALHLHYYAWKNIAVMLNNGVFQPDAALQGDIAHGRVPVISWVCDASMLNSDHVIASGDANEDAIITATARALAQYPGPVILRWFWEFNVLGNNQACRGDTGGQPAQQVYDDFIGAWRHIRQLFQTAGANNVVFLWNPGHYTADGNADDPHGFYPGNGYVDWIGLDTYQDSTSATFATNIEPFYNDFSQAQYAGKPLMVGENGSQNWSQHNQEFQAAYLQGVLAEFQMLPRLKAYCYFDSVGSHGSWLLDDNNGQGNGGLAAFAALAASAVFSPPAITLAANAEGESPTIAPNTWVEIKGLNLAPAGDIRVWTNLDFAGGKMPSQLDGVGVTVNGASAYVYYISPTQINILTPPDAISGPVQVVVKNKGATSTSFTAQSQALSPSFFVFTGGPYIAATHADGTLLGPASLYPGSTTPAKPGEIIVIYANGFGPTSTPVVSGSPMQSGTLSPLPDIKIAGISAEVQFAGLNITPGEFQFNVVVPPGTPAGDQSVTATYRGATTQTGVLLAVQR